MDTVSTLLQRNAHFATHGFPGEQRLMPQLRTIVLGCVDPRVDPSDVFELQLGEAAIIRNVGGRVTPDVLAQLRLLRTVTQAGGGDIGPGWELIILHHTDCGITRLVDSPGPLSAFLGIDEDALQRKAVGDPRAAVAVDIAALSAADGLRDEIVVSGLVYDVETGLVETVVPPEPLRSPTARA